MPSPNVIFVRPDMYYNPVQALKNVKWHADTSYTVRCFFLLLRLYTTRENVTRERLKYPLLRKSNTEYLRIYTLFYERIALNVMLYRNTTMHYLFTRIVDMYVSQAFLTMPFESYINLKEK